MGRFSIPKVKRAWYSRFTSGIEDLDPWRALRKATLHPTAVWQLHLDYYFRVWGALIVQILGELED